MAAHLSTAAQQQPTITHQNQYVPTNPDVDFEKVAKQFINKRLPLCVDEPTYSHYVQVCNMIYRNLRQIKSPFGSRKHGHLGVIQAAPMYANSSATSWNVPFTQPSIPTIPIGTNAQDTAKVFKECTIEEKSIQTAKHVTHHIRNLILAAWPDEYYVELKDTAFVPDATGDRKSVV